MVNQNHPAIPLRIRVRPELITKIVMTYHKLFNIIYTRIGRSLSNFVFFVQFKHDFFYFIKDFMKLCTSILHFDQIHFAIIWARD